MCQTTRVTLYLAEEVLWWDRGFESHVGSFMWNLESHTKLMWKNPFVAVGADWGRHFENGSSSHFAEPRHATTGWNNMI